MAQFYTFYYVLYRIRELRFNDSLPIRVPVYLVAGFYGRKRIKTRLTRSE